MACTHLPRAWPPADHGGVDLIGFPSTTMHVKEFEEALKQMHASKMYKELVFYLEACEANKDTCTCHKDTCLTCHKYTILHLP